MILLKHDKVHKDPGGVRSANSEQQLANIYFALAESITEATDEELLEEARLEGLDPKLEAKRVRALLFRAVDKFTESY